MGGVRASTAATVTARVSRPHTSATAGPVGRQRSARCGAVGDEEDGRDDAGAQGQERARAPSRCEPVEQRGGARGGDEDGREAGRADEELTAERQPPTGVERGRGRSRARTPTMS